MDNKSEVARIRRQIELEYEAVQRVFIQPAIISRHDFIEARQENLGNHFEELRKLISVEEAMKIFMEVADAAGH